MTDVKNIVHQIEFDGADQVNIEWRSGSSKVYPNKKPVELYIQITNDPENYLERMGKKDSAVLYQGFKWPADSLCAAIQLGIELGKYYGCNEEPPANIIDENKSVYLAAHVVYRGCD